MRRILVMGLSGNGKTWLASRMSKLMHIPHWDADVVREIYKDWDFSEGGRIRQAYRMNSLASHHQTIFTPFWSRPLKISHLH